MNITLLNISAYIVLIATFLGPILLSWRLRLIPGLPCSLLWFWLGLILWIFLYSAIDLEIDRLPYSGANAEDEELVFIMGFTVFVAGVPVGLIYCVLLSILASALKATLKDMSAQKRRK